MKLDEFWKEIQTKPIEAYIVTLKYKHDFETNYTVENQILEVEMSKYPNHYVWLSDWDEGQTDVEVVSYIAVSDVNTGNKPEPHWIPCSEKLPKEEKGHYWICTDTGYQCQCRWTNDVYGLGASDRLEWKIFDIPQYQKVIAWMPLPEPYKESI